jgi:iron complex transport system ATP-binding protein
MSDAAGPAGAELRKGSDAVSELAAFGLTVARGTRRILDGVDVRFAAGRLSFLVGPNGAGKSTLLRALAGIEAPSLEQARRVAWVPAETQAAFAFTVREVVLMGRYPWHLGHPGAADAARARVALEAVGASAWAGADVTRLSSGERQKVHIARALASDASFLLLDEPFANLDLAAAFRVLALLRDEARGGRGVVVCTHDLATAWSIADHVVCLDHGKVAAAGEPKASLTAELLARVFGVRARRARDEAGGERLVFDPL